MSNFFKKDSYWFGGVLGVILPAIALLIIAAIFRFFESVLAAPINFEREHLFLLSIMINLLPFRTYMVKFHYDKTGRAILGVTFLYVMAFFLFLH